jgi:hypothetical protein
MRISIESSQFGGNKKGKTPRLRKIELSGTMTVNHITQHKNTNPPNEPNNDDDTHTMRPVLTPHRYVVFILSLLSFTGLFFRISFQNVKSSAEQTKNRSWDEQEQHASTSTTTTDTTNDSTVQEYNYNHTMHPTNAPSKDETKPFPQSEESAKRMPLSFPQPQPAQEEEKLAPSPPPGGYKATIVVALSGEMANNLMHIAHGIGLQHWAKDEFGIDCNIVLRHHVGPNNRAPKPKWKSARNAIRQCFPKLADWDFAQGNTPVFQQQQNRQLQWLGQEKYDYVTGLINANNASDIQRGLRYFQTTILQDPNRPKEESSSEESMMIRLPYLYSQTLDAFPLIDKYYSEIKEAFAFNDSACCGLIPSPKEYAFHYRNYISEMPSQRAYEMGFAELSASKTASELFSNLPKGSKVGVTTRIPNQLARDQVNALKAQGMEAYLVEDQEGVQDFCYLKNCQNELVGNARSTFVFWAALLGQMESARLYHVDNWGLRQRHANFYERFTYNWTHPALKDRVKFELYQSEEMELGNNNNR